MGDNGISDNSEDNYVMYLSQQEPSLEIDTKRHMTYRHDDDDDDKYYHSHS